MTAPQRTICPYCGIGCGLLVEVEDSRVARVSGDAAHPSTGGRLCRKAVYLPQAVNASNRLLSPRLRSSRSDALHTSDWDTAMNTAAASVARITERHGPDSVAFYLSGQLLTEDYYVATKLARAYLGTNNVDSNSRLCMASTVAAYQRAFGADGPPCAYADFDLAECFFFVGSNAADCHPVLFQRAQRRKSEAPDQVTIVAIDPQRTRTTAAADLHLQLRPGTDVPLLQGLLSVVVRDGLVDEAFVQRHTRGWEAVRAAAEAWPPERASAVSGVPLDLLERAAHAFCRASATLGLWAMGLNQAVDGVDRNLALINLHLATGQVARPGAGPFSLTGQPNAMGGREVGGLAAMLPGHRSVTDSEHRRQMADLWGVPPARLNANVGLTGVEMFQALADGRLKAIWIAATNPMVSLPDLTMVRRGLERAEMVVVQDAYFPTETTDLAHVVLPAAQWAEKEGVTTSSERRVSYMPEVIPPQGSARPDWAIFADLGRRLGFREAFAYRSAEDVFREYCRCTSGTTVDISGAASYARLRQTGGVQWPCPAGATSGTERLYTNRQFATPDGRARFVVPTWGAEPQIRAAAGQIMLSTGRVRDQWHTMTRTGQVPQLLKSCPTPYLALHPTDAAELGLADGDWAEVANPGLGRAAFRLRTTIDLTPGNAFVPFHWGHHRHPAGSINTVMSAEVDPISGQPGLKFAAVSIRPCPPPSSSTEETNVY